MKAIKILRSRRYAVVLIILIIISLVISTVIPQRPRISEAEWFRVYGNNPYLIKIIKITGLDHVYTSWWFLTIICLFSLNIGLNLIERITLSYRQFRNEKILTFSQIEAMPLNMRIYSTKINPSVWKKIEDTLKSSGYHVKRSENTLLAIKGRIGYWWIPLFHAGLLITLIGFLVSGLLRFSATFEISEGQPFYGNEDEFLEHWYGLLKHRPRMNFVLILKRFHVEYYDNKHPKLYRSIVEIKEQNKAFTRVMEINKPLSYKRYTFYQTKYWGYSALFGIKEKNDLSEMRGYVNLPYFREYAFTNPLKQEFTIPGIGLKASLEYNPSIPDTINLEIKDSNRTLFNGRLNKWESIEVNGWRLSFYGIVKWTGIYVSSDPGVFVVYPGFILLILSSLGMVFLYPRKIWICLDGAQFVIGAHAGRRIVEFEEEFNKITNRLKEVLS